MDPSDAVQASPEEVLVTLRRCAVAGPFFAVEHARDPADRPDVAADGRPGPSPGGPAAGPAVGRSGQTAWSPASALVEPGDELAVAIEAVRRWASGTRPRVAASLFLMSYAARLLSASVAGVLLDGVLVDLRAHEWRYLPGTGLQLRLPVLAGWKSAPAAGPDALPPAPPADPDAPLPAAAAGRDALLTALAETLLDDHLAATVAAIRSVVPVSEGLLWGNVASSLAGALQSLEAVGVVRCREVGEVLLGTRHLRGTGGFVGAGLAFRRRSCCLFYLLPTSGKCADCALLR